MKAFLIICLCSLALFYGCLDNTINNTQFNISGVVLDRTGFPVYDAAVNTSSILWAETNRYGEFSINDMHPPYTIMFDSYYTHLNMFIGVKNRVNVFTLPQEYVLRHNEYHALVHFPPVAFGHSAVVIFASTEACRIDLNTSYANDSFTYIGYTAPLGVSDLRGKLIFLEYSHFEQNDYTYYKFGAKDTVLDCSEYFLNEFTFTGAETDYNPEEKEVTAKVNYPPSFTGGPAYFLLNFGSSQNNEITIGSGNSAIVPVLTLEGYKVKVISYSDGNNSQHIETWKYVDPGEHVILNNNIPPLLAYPPNNAENISDTSSFFVSDEGGPGIYEFNFSRQNSYNLDYIIYTAGKMFTLDEFMFRDDTLYSDCEYRWQVRKYCGFNSIDDFVSRPLVNIISGSSVETSEVRHFRTARRR